MTNAKLIVAMTLQSLGIVVTCAFFLSFPSIGQAGQISLENRSQLEAVTSRFIAENKIPGASIAIVENGQYVWSEGFGTADLETGVAADPTTLYRLASISKSITATAALQLAERGKLDLDAPVQRYCPAFPNKEAPITTRQLLGHLAGIRHYKTQSINDPEIRTTKHIDDPIQGGLDLFKDDPLVAVPGSSFHYSTHGYTLVGCAIEGASGEKYADYVRENVLAPAGMTHTQIDDRLAIIPRRTRFYSKTESGAIVNGDCVDLSSKVPGDGWLSSAEDMAKLEVAILNDRLLKTSTRDAMWTPPKSTDGKESDYALGWEIENGFGTLAVGHGGGEVGTSTFIIMIPARRAGVVVLMNLNGGNASALAPQLMKVLIAAK
jgi:serine beta-lactamase-like protein LACTB, mitochondrial